MIYNFKIKTIKFNKMQKGYKNSLISKNKIILILLNI